MIQLPKLGKLCSPIYKRSSMTRLMKKLLSISKLKLPKDMKLYRSSSRIMEKTNRLTFYWRARIHPHSKFSSTLTASIMKWLCSKIKPLRVKPKKQQSSPKINQKQWNLNWVQSTKRNSISLLNYRMWNKSKISILSPRLSNLRRTSCSRRLMNILKPNMSHYFSNPTSFMWLTSKLLTRKNTKCITSIPKRMINKYTKLSSKLTQSLKHMLSRSLTLLELLNQKNLIWTLELTLLMAINHCRISQMTRISSLLLHKQKSIIQT